MSPSLPVALILAASMQAPEGAIVGLVLISVFFLILVSAITFLVRAWDTKLLLLGLFTAVASVLLSFHEAEGVQGSVSVGGINQRVGVSVGGGMAAGLMRIGVILILAGVAATLWTRCCPAAPVIREEAPRVP